VRRLVDMIEPLELACCELLLELYRGARELSVAEFPGFAFGLLTAVLRFDTARYTALKFLDQGAVVCTSHLWNEAIETVLDWEQINRHDTVVPTVLSALGRAFCFHAPTLFAGPGKAIMRDFIQRTGHRNNLVIALLDDDEGLCKSLSLYRAGPEDRYAERDGQVLEALMPHVVEALRINESLGALAVRADADARASLAIAGVNGALHYVGPRFVELMRLEWPQWSSTRLPACALDGVSCAGGHGWSGRSIAFTVERIGELLFVRARALHPSARLSSRELRVAALYGAGRSHKEIARDLELSPVTVRNHLQHIYAKLRINDKAQLATMMSREGLA
jgi:DNA-binding CsgD family transcriptional regulator